MIKTQVPYCIPLFSPSILLILIHIAICLHCLLLSLFPPPSDDSEEEEEKGRPYTQEEQDIDIIRSWVEVGGCPTPQEEDAKELLTEVRYIPISFSLCFPLTYLLPFSPTISDMSDCYLLFPPSLQGLRLLQEASVKREEARKLEAEAKIMETMGWGKLREAVTGSKAEGLYYFALPSSHVPTPSILILPLPQFPHSSKTTSGIHRSRSFGSRRPHL